MEIVENPNWETELVDSRDWQEERVERVWWHAAKVPSMTQTGDVAVYIACTLDHRHFHVHTECNQSAWEAATTFFFFHSTIDTWAQGEAWALVYIKVNECGGFRQTDS